MNFHSMLTIDQGLRTTTSGPNPVGEGISFGCTDILSTMKAQYIYETLGDFVDYNLFRNNHIA